MLSTENRLKSDLETDLPSNIMTITSLKQRSRPAVANDEHNPSGRAESIDVVRLSVYHHTEIIFWAFFMDSGADGFLSNSY